MTTSDQPQSGTAIDPPTVRIPIQRSTEPVPSPVPPKRSGRGTLYSGLAVICIVLALILGLVIGGSGQPQVPGTLTEPSCDSATGCAKMPNLIGMTAPQTVAVLDAIGFTGDRSEFATVPAGWTVSSQGIPVGQSVAVDTHMPLSFSGPISTPAAPTVAAATPVPTPSADVATPTGPETSMTDGMYEIGVDIAPGRYKTSGGSTIGFCAWVVYSNASKDMANFVDGGSSTGQMYATVKRGQFLETSGGCTWKLQK